MHRHVVTTHALHQLLACLGAAMLVDDLIDREFHVLARRLSDPAFGCAILPPMPDGILRIVYNPDAPQIAEHVRAMVQQWWESGQPVVMDTLPALPAFS